MAVWLSVFCCQMYEIEPGSPHEAEAIRKGLMVVPTEQVSVVRAMTLHGRRRWFLSHEAPCPAPAMNAPALPADPSKLSVTPSSQH